MYERNYNGDNGMQEGFTPTVKSEGQLYNMQNMQREMSFAEEQKPAGALFDKLKGIIGGFETDDLILACIGLLILLDGEKDNDILVIFILALIFL